MTLSITQPSWIRAQVVRKILARFQAALPLYQDMLEVADEINSAAGPEESLRLGKVMHAAIRCASSAELKMIRDLFAVMNNEPVNYYDLRERVSVQSTAFRPVATEEIERNGFRIFCSLLSIECIDVQHHPFVNSIIDRRNVFDDELKQLISQAQHDGGLSSIAAERFVDKCVDVFTRPQEALVSIEEYHRLQSINKVAAQVLISNALAFNHLTPSVASVPAAHAEMQKRGIQTIPVWQGPVGKNVILRQTSCLAPPVKLKFPNGDGTFTEADYQETFVEFEERLQALTRTGRIKFEALFAEGKSKLDRSEDDPDYAAHYYRTMEHALADFPSDAMELWRKGLAYFSYRVADSDQPVPKNGMTFVSAVETGVIELVPQQYEDFFGPAATNIFNSNIGLDDVSRVGIAKADQVKQDDRTEDHVPKCSSAQLMFEDRLGCPVVDMYDYYDQIESESRLRVCAQLKIS